MEDFYAVINQNGAQWDVFERAEIPSLLAVFYGPDAEKHARYFAASLSVERQSQDRGLGGVS